MSIFNSIRVKKPKRTAFDLSHEVKFSCDFGQLVPFFVQEVLPGDTFKVSTEALVRFAPLIAPIMHRVNVYTHFFFVPNRLIWDEWKDFITGGEDGTASPVLPTVALAGPIRPGSLGDYLGLPVTLSAGNQSNMSCQVSALPFRAYHLIWNEYYRDQNLQDEFEIGLSSGVKPVDALVDNFNKLHYRAWEKDYFTSALPYPQRLPNPVTIPVGTEAEVFFDGSSQSSATFEPLDVYKAQKYSWGSSGANFEKVGSDEFQLRHNATLTGPTGSPVQTSVPMNLNPNGTLKADLSQATGVSINELRRGFSLQRWLENNARGGARYIEQILSHFGVRSSDARLQRPEYLGGSKTPVVISEVMQTSQSQDTPQGNYAGTGTSFGVGKAFKRWFEEHGYIIGILSVMPRSAYQQGIPRHFLKRDKFDFYWPEFAHLGEQEIKNAELYYDYTNTPEAKQENERLFGYTPRYAEYRFINSHVHGDMATSLNFWHLGRIFSSRPGLNGDFVTCKADKSDTGLNRIFAVTDTAVNHLWVQMYVNCKALRPLPKYGTPGL
ncbi:major capsid protein [Dipodfec virus UOA04_Rod_1087]|nr:major capsid protein [Dipodfec virus UOA04_Rod_1087]